MSIFNQTSTVSFILYSQPQLAQTSLRTNSLLNSSLLKPLHICIGKHMFPFIYQHFCIMFKSPKIYCNLSSIDIPHCIFFICMSLNITELSKVNLGFQEIMETSVFVLFIIIHRFLDIFYYKRGELLL